MKMSLNKRNYNLILSLCRFDDHEAIKLIGGIHSSLKINRMMKEKKNCLFLGLNFSSAGKITLLNIIPVLLEIQ